MPKAFAWILAAVAVLVVALFGLAIGVALVTQDPPEGSLDTDLEGVSIGVHRGGERRGLDTPPRLPRRGGGSHTP